MCVQGMSQILITNLTTLPKTPWAVRPKNWTRRKKSKKLEWQLQSFCVKRKRNKMIQSKTFLCVLCVFVHLRWFNNYVTVK